MRNLYIMNAEVLRGLNLEDIMKLREVVTIDICGRSLDDVRTIISRELIQRSYLLKSDESTKDLSILDLKTNNIVFTTKKLETKNELSLEESLENLVLLQKLSEFELVSLANIFGIKDIIRDGNVKLLILNISNVLDDLGLKIMVNKEMAKKAPFKLGKDLADHLMDIRAKQIGSKIAEATNEEKMISINQMKNIELGGSPYKGNDIKLVKVEDTKTHTLNVIYTKDDSFKCECGNMLHGNMLHKDTFAYNSNVLVTDIPTIVEFGRCYECNNHSFFSLVCPDSKEMDKLELVPDYNCTNFRTIKDLLTAQTINAKEVMVNTDIICTSVSNLRDMIYEFTKDYIHNMSELMIDRKVVNDVERAILRNRKHMEEQGYYTAVENKPKAYYLKACLPINTDFEKKDILDDIVRKNKEIKEKEMKEETVANSNEKLTKYRISDVELQFGDNREFKCDICNTNVNKVHCKHSVNIDSTRAIVLAMKCTSCGKTHLILRPYVNSTTNPHFSTLSHYSKLHHLMNERSKKAICERIRSNINDVQKLHLVASKFDVYSDDSELNTVEKVKERLIGCLTKERFKINGDMISRAISLFRESKMEGDLKEIVKMGKVAKELSEINKNTPIITSLPKSMNVSQIDLTDFNTNPKIKKLNSNKGIIIDIEGVDGTGKETQSKLLCNQLEKEGYKVKLVQFPNYQGIASFAVKEYLGDKLTLDDSNTDQYTLACRISTLYAHDRLVTWTSKNSMYGDKSLKDLYEEGYIIIFDRYVASNLIHQMNNLRQDKEKEAFISWVNNFEHNILGLPKPDITLLLTLAPSTSMKLIDKRGQKKDKHENYDHISRALANALELRDKSNWKQIVCDDASENEFGIRSKEKIHHDILHVIKGNVTLPNRELTCKHCGSSKIISYNMIPSFNRLHESSENQLIGVCWDCSKMVTK